MLKRGVDMDKDQMPQEPDVNLSPQELDAPAEADSMPSSSDVDFEAAQVPDTPDDAPTGMDDESLLPEPMTPPIEESNTLSGDEPEVGIMDEPGEVAVVTADSPESVGDTPETPLMGSDGTSTDDSATGVPTAEAPAAAPVAPVPVMSAQADVTSQPPKKPRKKGLILALIIAAILVVLGAGLAAAYVYWYQAPQKITNDALGSVISASKMSYTAGLATEENGETSTLNFAGRVDGNKATVDLSGSFTVDSMTVPLSVNAVMPDDGSYYVQINGIGDIIDAIAGDYADGYKLYFADTIAQIEGQWLKFSTDDYPTDEGDASVCEQKALESILSDQKSLATDVMKLYEQHPIYVATEKLGSRDIGGEASLGVRLTPSDDNLKSFIVAVQELPKIKALIDCDPEANAISAEDVQKYIDDAKNDDVTPTIELWASRITHQLTELRITSQDGDTKATLTFAPKLGGDVEPITAPESSTSIKELIDQLSATFAS